MENSNIGSIAKRYTDDKYACKEDVRKGMNTSLIDQFWNAIIDYRVQHASNLTLSSVSSQSFKLTSTEVIKEKFENVAFKLENARKSFIDLDEAGKESVRFKCTQNSLAYVGTYYGETLTPEFISTVIQGEASNFQGASQVKKQVIAYHDAYKQLGAHKVVIDADFLVKLYIAISKEENLTSIYRDFNFKPTTGGVFSNEHDGVPAGLIEKHMNLLFAFLNESHPVIVKAASAYFYINYVKPFKAFNNEIALLTLKAIIGNEGFEEFGYLLPFEELLKYDGVLKSDFKEVNRNVDITYAVIRVIEYTSGVIETFLDNCTTTKMSDLRLEHAPKADENPGESVSSVSDTNNQENSNSPIKEKQGSIAIHTIESGLEEKDAHRYEKYLLEKNPTLKEAQAHFYARHCTLGSYYTIQMYKKAERVVYETARTSMEALKDLGFYEKKQIKNKFVYTPIKQENK